MKLLGNRLFINCFSANVVFNLTPGLQFQKLPEKTVCLM